MADSKPSLIEYAGISGGRDYTRGFVGAINKWLPSQDSLLQQKSGGDLELYEVVATDDQVKSCLQQRFRALLSKDWEVIPGGDKRIDKQAAEHLEKQLEAINWDDCNEKMLWGIHYGYSAAEVLYERDGDKVVIADIKVRNRRRFHFNDEQQLVLKTMQNPLGEDLPERKFWHFCTGADHDDEPYGRGLGHWLYWPTFFKRNGVRWWLKFVEKYAQPTRLGKYPAGATQSEKDTLWNALGSFGDDARSMIPEGLEMEFLESSRAGTVDYKSLCDQMDGAIAKIILSQTMTTDDGSSKSQAEVHEGVKDEVIESDSDLLCESFNNSVAVWLTDWNYPGAAYPKVRRKIQADPDPATMADTDTKLQGLGISLKPEAIAAKYGEDYLVPDNKEQTPQLNGEQVNALVAVIVNATQGGWKPELVAGVINGAFPGWSDEAVNAITSNLGSTTPVADPDAPVSNRSVPNADRQAPTNPTLEDVAGMFAAAEFKMQEGTTKEKNGKIYVLKNSRWTLAKPTETAPATTKPVAEKKAATKKPLTETQKKKKEKIVKDAGIEEKEPTKKPRKKKGLSTDDPFAGMGKLMNEDSFDDYIPSDFDWGGMDDEPTKDRKGIPKDAKLLGEGAFGAAYVSKGKVYKKNFVPDPEGNKMAMKVQNIAATAGVAPKVHKATKDLMVMDMAEGVVGDTLSPDSKDWLDFRDAAISSVIKMHRNGVVHGDLAPRNLMYSKEKGVSVIDFGSSGFAEKGGTGFSFDIEELLFTTDSKNTDSPLVEKVKEAIKSGTYNKFLDTYDGK